jgi:transglutaminase-like putative cysteine protease
VLAKARKVERYLRETGGFSYSLKAGRRVNRNLDPVEDFLLYRKEGHCEYFASALALLLRAKGIPARVISGFHGGEWNEMGGFYQVRQFHAHSWVEAYLPPETHDEVVPFGQWPEGGRWVVLDGTPASERAEVVSQQENSRFSGLKAYGDYMQYLWSSYVLGMDADKQRDAIYNPISRGATGVVTSLFDREAWRRMFDDFFRRVAVLDWSYFQGEWFNWRGFVVTTGFLWACVGAVRLAQWFSDWLGRRRQAAAQERAHAQAEVEFYRRLEQVLARLRLGRKRGQTPREFAVEAGGRLADQPERQPLAALPRRIVEAFYRVRYGGQTLSSQDMALVDTALAELEVRLAPDPRVDGLLGRNGSRNGSQKNGA